MIITCNEQEMEVPENVSGFDILKKLNKTEPSQGIALFINGAPKEFSETIQPNDSIEIADFDDPRGKEVFWHTSAHVLAQAILRLYPDAKLTIGPPIENGFYYDFANLQVSEKDFPLIEKEAQKIIKENFKPERSVFSGKKDALQKFKENPYKVELIEGFADDAALTWYTQGEFFDLCRGPHLSSLGKIKAFKVLKTSAAYWKGDPSRESLTRIYGISFPDRTMLKEYLHVLEEAKKRDHRILGAKLGLFQFFDVAPGMPIFQPNGMVIWNRLLEFWHELHRKGGYLEIKTPAMMDKSLWETSGHWENYRENMYTSEIDDRIYAIKPMNCPAGMLHYASKRHSYRDLPLRIGEIGNVHRHEKSGSLSGLLRVRCFHQDDAHIFMKPSDIKDEILGVLSLVDKIYQTFGLEYKLELSTRPEKNTIGTDEEWEMATEGLKKGLEAWGKPFSINAGDGAFYGPKIDIHVVDALNRSWQCGTVQLDMSLPERFSLEYTDSDGGAKRPIMIHRAIYGSIERFMAILIEHFSGKFPLWLSPQPLRLICVADRHVDYAKKVAKDLEEENFLVSIDDSHESVSKKIRLAQMQQVNYMLTIGDQECENSTISVRTRKNQVLGSMTLPSFIEKIKEELLTKSLNSLFEE